jgi:hypothetical protein
MVVDVRYVKDTGEIIHTGNEDKYEEDQIETALLITDREVLFKLT